MDKKNNTLVIIPARAGSKGIPHKNIKHFLGKPLINWTIDVARQLFDDANICVTTDGQEIINTVNSIGLQVPFVRPENLASDTSGTYDVLLHAIDFYEQRGFIFDKIVLLQPTSPLRKAIHIQEALDLYTNDLDMVVSVVESDKNPYYNLFEEENGLLKKSKQGNFIRRQDCPKVYSYNGSIYIINVNSLKNRMLNEFNNIKKYEMDLRSSVDLDTPLDWEWAEFLALKEKNNEFKK